jgi:UDP-N-acetylglucosamine 2-epimerase
MFAEMITAIGASLDRLQQIRWVVVFGDANCTLAAALAGAYRRKAVLHIEAGVRSGDISTYEEINRRAVDHIASAHYCATERSVRNLASEGITSSVLVGDLARDTFDRTLALGVTAVPEVVPGYILVAIHKAPNVESPIFLHNLFIILHQQPRSVLFVCHPNTRRRLRELGLEASQLIHIVGPLSYPQMVSAEAGAAFVITDSGGIQREAAYLGKRCLVRRDRPGWSELIHLGVNRKIDTTLESIQAGIDWIENACADPYPAIDLWRGDVPFEAALAKLINETA